MALPGQAYRRVLLLLLDCGSTMQQPFPPEMHAESLTASTTVITDSVADRAATNTYKEASVPQVASATAAITGSERMTPLHLLRISVLRYLQGLAVTSAKVDVAVISFGSANTYNRLAPAGERSVDYLHVEELLQPEQVSWQTVRTVEKCLLESKAAAAAPTRSDWLDAVVVAADLLEHSYGPKLLQHEVYILLFSDFSTKPASEEDLGPVAAHLKKLDIQLISILITPPSLRLPRVLFPSEEQLQRQGPLHWIKQKQKMAEGGLVEEADKKEEQIYYEEVKGKRWKGLVLAERVSAAIVPWKSFCSSAALRCHSSLVCKRLSTKCRVNLNFSSFFSIPLYVFLLTKAEALLPLKKRVFKERSKQRRIQTFEKSASGEGAAEPQKKEEEEAEASSWDDVKIERYYYRATDPERKPLHPSLGGDSFTTTSEKHEAQQQRFQKLHAYRYGKQIVVLSPLEQQALLKPQTPPGLNVLGVVPLSSIRRWWIVGNSEYATSCLNSLPGLLALRSLVLALQRMQASLICSFTWRQGQPSRPVALLPHTYFTTTSAATFTKLASAANYTACTGGSDNGRDAQQQKVHQQSGSDAAAGAAQREKRICYGLRLVYLPFAEDMQELRLPSLRAVTAAQLLAVEKFVDVFTLPSPAGVGFFSGASAQSAAATAVQRELPLQNFEEETAISCSGLLQALRLGKSDHSNSGKRGNAMYTSLTNPYLEIWENAAYSSPSPPCTSPRFPSFLPSSISLFASATEHLDPRFIYSPARERFYSLLVYRHYNRVEATNRDDEAAANHQQQQQNAIAGISLWPPFYVPYTFSSATTTAVKKPNHSADSRKADNISELAALQVSTAESLFTWGTHTSTTSEKPELEASTQTVGMNREGNTKIVFEKLLLEAFPLVADQAAQQTLRERKSQGQKQLWGNIFQRQRQLLKHQEEKLQPVEQTLQLHDVELPEAALLGKASDAPAEEAEVNEKGEQVEELEMLSSAAKEEAVERQAEEEARQQRIATLKQLCVRSVNPVRDFNRMLDVREVDLTDKAVNEMIDVIHRFLKAMDESSWQTRPSDAAYPAKPDEVATESGADSLWQHQREQQLLGKAFACVIALREGCKREMEGASFNSFMRSLNAIVRREQLRHEHRETTATTDNKCGTKSEITERLSPVEKLWSWLRTREIGLITVTDDPRAGVPAGEELSIYKGQTESTDILYDSKDIEKDRNVLDALSVHEQELLDLVE